jgi:hypothetical protein
VKHYLLFLTFLFFTVGSQTVKGQSDSYHYHLDLNNVTDDKVQVELKTPPVDGKSVTFHMPNIIPGTYMESNYGMFVSELKA